MILSRLRRRRRRRANCWESTDCTRSSPAPPLRAVRPAPSRPQPPSLPRPHHERELLVEVRVAVVVDGFGLLVAPAPHLAAHVQVVAAADALQA